ncbi:MAG: DUF3019 domain-containing protein [Kangiellaceae bacterium]
MFFKGTSFIKSAGCILVLIVAHFNFDLNAEEVDFNIKTGAIESLNLVPSKCVALRKGRECFATIKITWQVSLEDNYCLRRAVDKLQINCWIGTNKGAFSYIFRSNIDERIELIRTKDSHVIAVSKVKVSWVYNSNKRRKRWRIF